MRNKQRQPRPVLLLRNLSEYGRSDYCLILRNYQIDQGRSHYCIILRNITNNKGQSDYSIIIRNNMQND